MGGNNEKKAKLEINLKEKILSYIGPAKHVEFICVIFALVVVNIVIEWKVSGFPESISALFMCMMIISIVSIILLSKKRE